jgi:type IV pilus assembly protein PilB
MPAPRRRPAIAQQLIDERLADPALVDAGLERARHQNQSLVRYLLNHRQVSPAALADCLARLFGLQLCDPGTEREPAQLPPLDPSLLRRLHALPLRIGDGGLLVAVSDPGNVNAQETISLKTGLSVTPVIAADDRLKACLDELAGEDDHAAAQRRGAITLRDGDDAADDSPAARYIDDLLGRAAAEGASDIHLEPLADGHRIRLRQDGLLTETAIPPAALGPRLTTRLKVMARLDIAERRLPQDGRIRIERDAGAPLDFRVSTLPTLFGEKLVLRLLDGSHRALALDRLGMNAAQIEQYRQALQRPYGIILVTGPTGSGKTMTLYSGLETLNTPERNLLTVEDPVEIRLPGVNQVAINPRIGLDFPAALRAFLRQDPDIMMVGEIRDRETAEIAIKAAQTGHLVLSTLHTDDALGAITRLANMGVPRWSLAATLNLVTAQRLVRCLCPECRRPTRTAADADDQAPEQACQTGIDLAPVGCHQCRDGYDGRTGIHELLPVTPELAECIAAGATRAQLDSAARRAGYQNLHAIGLQRVAEGVTSRQEIDRIIR